MTNGRRSVRYVKTWPIGRQPQPQIKQRLLDACTDYALEHGLPDRLGPFAAATGTSSRMLIYHFETRDGLLREVLGQARRRQVEAFTELIRLRPDEPYPATLARAWSAISGPEGAPYLRLFSPLPDNAVDPLWPGFRRTATTDWLAPLEDGMRSLGRSELATVVLAVIRGLLMDLDATGDTARTHRAFAAFLTTIDGACSDAQQLSRLVAMVDAGKLRVDVAERVPLAELPALHARAASGAVAGKAVVLVAAD
jgi:AcrR family transcriptional regulator